MFALNSEGTKLFPTPKGVSLKASEWYALYHNCYIRRHVNAKITSYNNKRPSSFDYDAAQLHSKTLGFVIISVLTV